MLLTEMLLTIHVKILSTVTVVLLIWKGKWLLLVFQIFINIIGLVPCFA